MTLCLVSAADPYPITPLLRFTPASPLECAHPKNVSASPLQCALAKSLDLNPPGMNSYKNTGGSPPPCQAESKEAGKQRGRETRNGSPSLNPVSHARGKPFLLPCILASLLPASRSFRVREHSSVDRLCGGRGGVKRENAKTSVPGNHFLGGGGDGISDDGPPPPGARARANAFDGDLAVRDFGGGGAAGRAGRS